MQERDVTAEGSTLRGVVWVADGASMVRVSPSNLRTLSEAEKTLCTLKDTDVLQFQDMVRRLPNTTYLDLVDQPGPDHEEFERPLSGFEDPVSSRVILPAPISAGNSAPAETASAPENPFTMPPSSSTELLGAPAPAPASSSSSASSRPQREHEDAEMTEPRTRPSD